MARIAAESVMILLAQHDLVQTLSPHLNLTNLG